MQGMRVTEFMCVTNVDGPFQTHTQVRDIDERIRKFVEPSMVTSWSAPR